MCSPQVIEQVRNKLSRRGFLALAGAAAAVGVGMSTGRTARAQASSAGLPGGRFSVQDLSHVITPEFPVFPGFPQFEASPLKTIEDDGFFANRLSLGEHTGTHMDAPAHFVAGGATAEKLPAERFFAPLAVVDISRRATTDADAMVEVDDILAWEEQNGPLPSGAFLATYTGWEERLSDPASFLNLDSSDPPHFPGYGPKAAEFLVNERDVVGVGIDTLSLDKGAATEAQAHLAILGAGKYGLENLANLGEVVPAGATIVVGGPKHQGASGGPSRVFAVSSEPGRGGSHLPETGGSDHE